MARMTDRERQMFMIKIYDLYGKGYSHHEIADILKVSLCFINAQIRKLNLASVINLQNVVADRMPLEIMSSIELLRSLITICLKVANEAKDYRVVLQAVSEIRQTSEAISRLLVDTQRVSESVKAVMESHRIMMEDNRIVMEDNRRTMEDNVQTKKQAAETIQLVQTLKANNKNNKKEVQGSEG